MKALQGFNPNGKFTIELIRDGKTIHKEELKNGITIEGKNHLLDLAFHGAAGPAKINIWYIGIVDNANFVAFDEADTYDNIDQVAHGWDEWIDYTDANNGDSVVTRPIWVEGAASNKAITTDTPQAIYDVVAAGNGDTIEGIFICGGGDATDKADHTAGTPPNVLWSTGAFAASIVVATADQLKITYTLSC